MDSRRRCHPRRRPSSWRGQRGSGRQAGQPCHLAPTTNCLDCYQTRAIRPADACHRRVLPVEKVYETRSHGDACRAGLYPGREGIATWPHTEYNTSAAPGWGGTSTGRMRLPPCPPPGMVPMPAGIIRLTILRTRDRRAIPFLAKRRREYSGILSRVLGGVKFSYLWAGTLPKSAGHRLQGPIAEAEPPVAGLVPILKLAAGRNSTRRIDWK